MPSKVLKGALSCFLAKNADVERRTSKELEKKLSRWTKEYNQVIRVLLLGAGESGKTTIIKQMKILHIEGFNDEERREKVTDIRKNVLESIISLVRQMTLVDVAPCRKRAVRSLNYLRQLPNDDANFEYTNEFYENVKTLWGDSNVKYFYDSSAQYVVPECAKYFLDRLGIISSSDYVPTDQDILFCRKTTTSVQKIEFDIKLPKKYGTGSQKFWMFDVGGQKGERRKWIQVFDGVQTILFLVACNAFDQFMVDDPTVNKLRESITLFQDVWSSRFLQDSGFIVFLNKQDLLKKKVEAGVNIGHYFPEYYVWDSNHVFTKESYPDEYMRTREFIKDLFLDAQISAPPPPIRKYSLGPGFAMTYDREHLRTCYWHFTTATDTSNINTVFLDVQHMIITTNLKTIGLM